MKIKEAEPSAQSSQQRAKSASIPSIISADVVLTGTLFSNGDIQVDGRIEGDIRAVSVMISEFAAIYGNINSDEVIVRGRVEGSIHARKLQLCATSHILGNIVHEVLSVDAGAFFEGTCRQASPGDRDNSELKLIDIPPETSSKNGATPLVGGDQHSPPAASRAAASFTPHKS